MGQNSPLMADVLPFEIDGVDHAAMKSLLSEAVNPGSI
jgi:hypothetical protein